MQFAEDLAQIAGSLPRRELLRFAAATGLMAALPRAARAAVPEVVVCNWGGDAVPAFTQAFVKAYEQGTGGKLVIDGSGPANGKIRAMVEAKNVSWDLCDSGVTGLAELVPRGLLTPIDYSVVDKAKVLPGFTYEYGVCNYFFSTVQAWEAKKVPEGYTPTLADFFDLKKIPGRRMIRKDSQGDGRDGVDGRRGAAGQAVSARRGPGDEEARDDQGPAADLGHWGAEPVLAAGRRGEHGLAVEHAGEPAGPGHQGPDRLDV